MSLASELEELATFSESVSPAVTRIVFSKQDIAARVWLKEKFEHVGLKVREDAIGNTFARWNGSDPTADAVATGSHIDAIPNAGRFDGTVGVLGGLEAIRTLQVSGFVPRRSIELILFTAEEPTRFGIGCLGSRMIAGALSAECAKGLAQLEELRTAAGFSGPLETVRQEGRQYASFVELHIEQGKILEKDKIDIGIVTHIAAPAGMRVFLKGAGGHAGAVLMGERKDALVAAADVVSAVEAAALKTGSADSVATTGVCKVFPGAVNSVPSEVQLEIDVRDIDQTRRDGMIGHIKEACAAIAQRRNVQVDVEMVNADDPGDCNVSVVEAITESCKGLGLSYRQMVSRAYHDSLFMSRLAPTAMIFHSLLKRCEPQTR